MLLAPTLDQLLPVCNLDRSLLTTSFQQSEVPPEFLFSPVVDILPPVANILASSGSDQTRLLRQHTHTHTAYILTIPINYVCVSVATLIKVL